MIKDSADWLGMSGFIWFMGVVEDIHDPLNVGRVRVRCYGWHTANRAMLPVGDLPWAQVMMPATSASFSGIGESATGLINGSNVVGFFMDGETAQMPLIMGTFHGIPNAPRFFEGFSDPDRVYPIEPDIPDTPKLAYDKFIEDATFIDRIENRETDVPTAADGFWDEPLYRERDSAYPDNHVYKSKSGHVREIDDTPGAERLHEYHRSGTFTEIQVDGTKITKVVGDDFEIVIGGKNVYIKGECNVTILGDAKIKVDGDMIQEVAGDYQLKVGGSILIDATKGLSLEGATGAILKSGALTTIEGAQVLINGSTVKVEGTTDIPDLPGYHKL